MSNPILTLGTYLPGKLYISSRPLSSKHSLSASRYLLLQTKDLADEKRLKDRISEVKIETMGRVFDLVLRDAVVEGIARRKSKEEKKKEKSEEDVEKEGLYTKPLDSSSVEDFFAATEDPADAIIHPIFSARKSLPGFPFTASIEPQRLEDIPKQEVVVIVHRETREISVRKTDGKVYRVKVKTDKQEEPNQVDERELGKQIGKDDEKEAITIKKIIGEKRDIGQEWDDCMV